MDFILKWGNDMFEDIENLKIVSSLHRASKPSGKVSCRETHGFNIRVSGSILYDFDGRTILVNAGEMIFIPQGSAYKYKTISNGESVYTNINFKADFKNALPMKYSLSEFYDTDYICAHFSDLWRFGTQSERYKCISLMYNLISYLSNTESSSYPDKKKHEIIEPAVEYLKKHIYDCSLKTVMLHKLCGISDTYFRKIFISRFGTSPHNYIISKRISHAKSIVECGEFDTVRELSESVGYSDPLYFGKVYKKFYGVSPSKIQK